MKMYLPELVFDFIYFHALCKLKFIQTSNIPYLSNQIILLVGINPSNFLQIKKGQIYVICCLWK